MFYKIPRNKIIGLLLSLALSGCWPFDNNSDSTGSNGNTGGNTNTGIGPAGGTVVGFYGSKVTIPAGALATTVDIAMARDSTNAPALPSTGIDTAGAPYALTPHGTAFSQPVTVQIPFDIDRIPTDADPVLYKAEPGGAFTAIPTTVDNNMLIAEVSNFSWVIPGYASTLPRMVYALTRADVSGTSTVSVSSFKITKGTGALSPATSSAPVGTGAISVTVHPSRRFLYVTNGAGSAHGAATGVPANSISVYQLDAVTGAITGPTDSKPVNGNPISVVVHPNGKFVYVVNEVRFGSDIGNVSAFSIDPTTGTLTSQGTVADSGGAAPATALAFSPSGEFAYVTYQFGTSSSTFSDTVKTYGVSPTSGQFTSNPIGSASTGDSPWAMVVTPGGHFGYVVSLSNQGSVNQFSVYTINQTTGVMNLTSSSTISAASGQAPLSLAMDPEGRFLYVGFQSVVFVSGSNFNVWTFHIDPNSGAPSFVSGVATGSNPQGPISVVAEPQAQFVYVMDGDGELVTFAVGSNGALTPAGTAISGVFLGGNTGGVGDPFFFAASGTSPVWEDACTQMIEYYIQEGAFPPTGGCFLPVLSSTADGSGGDTGTGAPPPSPAATHVLTVYRDPTWGGNIVSSPAGINYGDQNNFFEASFSTGSTVTLSETPSPVPSQAYDVEWTGSCSGTGTSTSVVMSQDQHCYLSLTPVSTR